MRDRGDFRQALIAAAASTVAPGSGYVVAGRRRAGWAVLAVFLTGAAATLVFVLTQSRGDLLAIWVQPRWLIAIMALTLTVAIVWCGVIVSSYVLSQPDTVSAVQHLMATGLLLALCAAVVLPLGRAAQLAYVQHDLITTLFPSAQGPAPRAAANEPDPFAGNTRINVLLLGSDGDPSRDGVRTDSVTLASVDLDTGDTVLFSLPRNLYKVPFSPGSPMAVQFPTGFRGDPVQEYVLYAVYRYGTDHPELVPNGGSNPGARLVMDAVETILGLDLDYYIIVNLRGFQNLVDAIGGIHIRVEERLPIGGVGAPIVGWIEPGLQHLDGFEALWYSRSRATTDDYDRMSRQRCVFGAIARQADPVTVLRRYTDLASAAKETIQTNIPQDLLPELAKVAGNAKSAKIANVQFVPPLIDTIDPDYEVMREAAQDAIAASEHPRPTASATTTTGSNEEIPGESTTADEQPIATVSLDDVCAYE